MWEKKPQKTLTAAKTSSKAHQESHEKRTCPPAGDPKPGGWTIKPFIKQEATTGRHRPIGTYLGATKNRANCKTGNKISVPVRGTREWSATNTDQSIKTRKADAFWRKEQRMGQCPGQPENRTTSFIQARTTTGIEKENSNDGKETRGKDTLKLQLDLVHKT